MEAPSMAANEVRGGHDVVATARSAAFHGAGVAGLSELVPAADADH
jgi:hypothetical protein